MITDEYKEQLKELHEGRRPGKKWGTTGARNFGDYIVRFLEHRRGQIRTVLDFGAGQRSLESYVRANAVDINIRWTNYDPGQPDIDVLPDQQFDLICSSDVLEHVEPDKIDETIAWMRDHADKAQFHHIACDPCGITLPDGRNAHLITETLDWWLPKFDVPGWSVMYTADCTVKKRGGMRRHCHIQVDKG